MFKGTTITATCSSEFGCCKLNSVYDWYLNFWCLFVVSSPPPLSSHPTPRSPGHPTCALRSQSPLLVHISRLFEDPPVWTCTTAQQHHCCVVITIFFRFLLCLWIQLHNFDSNNNHHPEWRESFVTGIKSALVANVTQMEKENPAPLHPFFPLPSSTVDFILAVM